MNYSIIAKTRAREEKVERIDATHLRVSVKAAPIGGKANAAIEAALAEFFDVPPSAVAVIKGQTAKNKIVEVAL